MTARTQAVPAREAVAARLRRGAGDPRGTVLQALLLASLLIALGVLVVLLADVVTRAAPTFTGVVTLPATVAIGALTEYADDAAAAAGSLAVGRLYRTGSIIKVRVA